MIYDFLFFSIKRRLYNLVIIKNVSMNNMYLNIYVIFLCNIYQYICIYFIRFDKGDVGEGGI